MYKKEYVKLRYISETVYNEKKAHIVFYAHKKKGDRHIYDSAFIIQNEPKKEYSRFEIIPEEDYTVTFLDNGHIKNIEFK